MKRYLTVPGLSLALLAACSDSDSKEAGSLLDGGKNDAASPIDASNRDGGAEDAALPDDDGSTQQNDATVADDASVQPAACDPSAAPSVGALKLTPVISNVPRLVYAAQPQGSQDWYLVQQTGQVLLRADGSATNTTLLDLTDDVTATISDSDERGLLSIAFPPDFATSNLFYVMLTPNAGAGINTDQVRQYRKSGTTATLTETLLTVPASAVNHNGGTVAFGPDGMLYVGTGDGGDKCGTNKPGAPQDVASPYGKILRLDPSKKADGWAAAGNPFSENKLVWHYGLRNPFRFSFDRANGDLFIGDVGQDAYEEVSHAKAGTSSLNFGWAAYEGAMTPPQGCAASDLRANSMHTPPIFISGIHGNTCPSTNPFCRWISVVGGVVYRGNEVPALKGAYVFGDYQGPNMAALYQCASGTSPVTAIAKNRNANTPNAPYFEDSGFGDLTAIVEDSVGELYFIVNRNSLRKVAVR